MVKIQSIPLNSLDKRRICIAFRRSVARRCRTSLYVRGKVERLCNQNIVDIVVDDDERAYIYIYTCVERRRKVRSAHRQRPISSTQRTTNAKSSLNLLETTTAAILSFIV
jgi:hypothetical protein